MEDVARYLVFGANQALQEGNGFVAQQRAAQLHGLITSEVLSCPAKAQLMSAMQRQCHRVLQSADNAVDVQNARWVHHAFPQHPMLYCISRSAELDSARARRQLRLQHALAMAGCTEEFKVCANTMVSQKLLDLP